MVAVRARRTIMKAWMAAILTIMAMLPLEESLDVAV
jgi:hypothetical protein